MFNIEVRDGKFIATVDFDALSGTASTPAEGFMNIAQLRGFFLQATDECLANYFNAMKTKVKVVQAVPKKNGGLNIIQ